MATTLTREELAERCASTSFDKMIMDYDNKKVIYINSFRDGQATVLEEFRTEVHFSVLQPRPLTSPEERTLLAFGLCYSTFLFTAVAKRSQLLQIRAGYFSPEELAFFTPALAGALAEYFYLADLDLAAFRLEGCCEDPASTLAESTPPPPAASEPATAATMPPTSPLPVATAAGAEPTSVPIPAGKEETTTITLAPASSTHQQRPRVLVPFGGGKDSTLLMELLGRMGAQVGWVYFGEWVGSWGVYSKFAQLAEASPEATVFLAEQNLPCFERLKELNLVPELPFQDYCASVSFYTFTAAFMALQHGFDYICVGNEYSANAINTTHPKYDYPVNHQYEKSFKAECAFHAYLRDHINPRLYYFSGLQHMTELEIAMRFAAICATKYLDLIISCNWAMDNDWCGGCEKCAFVFLLFAAFLPVPDIMSKVFGVSLPPTSLSLPSTTEPATATAATGFSGGDTSSPIVPGSRESLRNVYDMYDSERHVPIFESLMGLAGHKPFECVGTPEECLAAMYLSYKRYLGGSGGDKGDSGDANHKKEQHHHMQQQQQKMDQEEQRLPLLLRKHEALIASKGKEEWEKIEAEIKKIRETGRPSVPTLYPDWFRLDV